MILSLPIGGLSSEATAAGPKRELIDHHDTLLAQNADVGYGSKADIVGRQPNFCLVPKGDVLQSPPDQKPVGWVERSDTHQFRP